MKENLIINRRKFFEKVIRGGLFAGLTGISAYFVLREKTNDDNCDFDFVCRNCRKNRVCQLPEASSFRFHGRMKKTHGQ